MNYWWVNQNQTYRQEQDGGYLWSPKRKFNGARNPFYEYMRRVSPGDLVFSFSDTVIKAISVVQSTAYGFPKPEEFAGAGANWSDIGWKVDVTSHEFAGRVRPADHVARLGRLLPDKYAPLQQNGRGNQSVYLSSAPPQTADMTISVYQ